ncbi:MAG: hypothetical protein PHO66_01520 [Eubacteriales bacterium]|nr:hypothetical protein [Eubacteriales bacterium]
MANLILTIGLPPCVPSALSPSRVPAVALGLIGAAMLGEFLVFFVLQRRRSAGLPKGFGRKCLLLGAALLCCAALWGGWAWANTRYAAALVQLDSGDYAGAYAAFYPLPESYRETRRCRMLCEAGAALTQERFAQAVDLLDALGGFRNADALARQYETQLIRALIDAGRLNEALEKCHASSADRADDVSEITLYLAQRKMDARDYAAAYAQLLDLVGHGYLPARDSLEQCAFLYAQTCYEAGDYVAGIPPARTAGGTGNAPELLRAMQSGLYPRAIARYHAREYDQALVYFNALGGYQRSGDYRTLLQAHRAISAGDAPLLPTLCKALFALGAWEDAPDLLAQPPLLGAALEGVWQADDDTITFHRRNDGSIHLETAHSDEADSRVVALSAGAVQDSRGQLLYTVAFDADGALLLDDGTGERRFTRPRG